MLEKAHDLTMLFLSKSDISDLTPAELVDKYNGVYEEISRRLSETKKPVKVNTNPALKGGI